MNEIIDALVCAVSDVCHVASSYQGHDCRYCSGRLPWTWQSLSNDARDYPHDPECPITVFKAVRRPDAQ